ncbi:MAG: phage terminase large subunit [Acidimicrobiia bacterium]|nr:phage terminase large subunit [Acidimicrobiia bacterium]
MSEGLKLLDADLLKHASPDEVARYELLLQREVAKQSPLDLACWLSPTTKRWLHIEYLNERIVALAEYRLYPDGPGPPPRWYYVKGEKTFPALSYEQIPDDVDEFYGEHPETGVRVVFRLAISMPPRHGKSYLITEYTPLWYLLRYPDRDIAFATYSDDFAQEWGVKLRDALVEHEADTGLVLKGGKSSAAARLRLESGGQVRLVGTGGALTGTGNQLSIIDDPIKDQTEALSQATRNAKANWYTSTFSTRKTRVPGKGIPVEIMMFTRWHEDDPAGRFAYDDNNEPAEGWCVVRVPALAEEDDPLGREPGEALCPQVKTKAELLTIQKEDPTWFAALYQGDPSQDETGIFGGFHFYVPKTTDNVEYYQLLPLREDEEPLLIRKDECVRFSIVDLAASLQTWADWSVYAVWDFHRPTQKLILVDRIRERVESADHEAWLRKSYSSYPSTAFVGIENKTFGQTLVQTMLRKGGMTVRPLKADRDKVARAIPYGQGCKNGSVYLPKKAEWLYNWMQEHKNFPRANTHDDQVDVGAYAWDVALTMPSMAAIKEYEAPTMQDKVDKHLDKIEKKRKQGRRRHILSGRLGY